MELRAAKGFASPLHIHRNEDEVFVVLPARFGSSTVRPSSKAVAARSSMALETSLMGSGSTQAEARLFMFFGPAGVEGFFREGGKVARSFGLPPADEQFLDKPAPMAVGSRYREEFVGPPLPPKD